MAYEVLIDPGAIKALDEVVDYVANVLGSPQAAADILEGFDELVCRLEEMPLSYPMSQDGALAARGYRRALIGKYVVLFRVWEGDGHAGTVWLTNIFHGSQDYFRLV